MTLSAEETLDYFFALNRRNTPTKYWAYRRFGPNEIEIYSFEYDKRRIAVQDDIFYVNFYSAPDVFNWMPMCVYLELESDLQISIQPEKISIPLGTFLERFRLQ